MTFEDFSVIFQHLGLQVSVGRALTLKSRFDLLGHVGIELYKIGGVQCRSKSVKHKCRLSKDFEEDELQVSYISEARAYRNPHRSLIIAGTSIPKSVLMNAYLVC